MSPALISVIIFAVQEAIKHAPGLVTDLRTILSKSEPTDEDWDELRKKVASKGYYDYVPASSIPRSGQ